MDRNRFRLVDLVIFAIVSSLVAGFFVGVVVIVAHRLLAMVGVHGSSADAVA